MRLRKNYHLANSGIKIEGIDKWTTLIQNSCQKLQSKGLTQYDAQGEI